jgi:hypothetical protein
MGMNRLGNFKKSGLLFSLSFSCVAGILLVAAQFDPATTQRPVLTLEQATEQYHQALRLRAENPDLYQQWLFKCELELQAAINRQRAQECEVAE